MCCVASGCVLLGRPPAPGCLLPRRAELGPAPDNIRITHWIGDNNLLLVSYIDKPNVE